MRAALLPLGVFAATVAFAATGAVAGSPPLLPLPAPDQFGRRIDNPWFPLIPGTRLTYRGAKDRRSAIDVMTVTSRTQSIEGIGATVVSDRLFEKGRLAERTTDFYAQDRQGNVWYLGEDTAELDARGQVTSTEGTWTAGVNGAKPGIYMPTHPRIGQAAEQEYYKGHAEDHFKVIGLFGTVSPPGTKNTLLTQETTPLEPGTVDHKMYVRGIGTVLEQTERGPNERNELVSVTRGA